MKKFIGIIALVLLCFCAGAQSLSPKVQVGIRAGINFADFRSLQNSNFKSHKDVNLVMAGGFAQVRLFKKFGLRAEVLYNPKGSLVSYYDSVKGGNTEAVTTLRYTDITLSAIYNFRVVGFIPMYAFAGYGYENLVFLNKPVTSTSNMQITTKDFAKNASNIVAGLGIRISIKKINILPEIRYLYGLTDVNTTNVVTRNKAVTISLGISKTL